MFAQGNSLTIGEHVNSPVAQVFHELAEYSVLASQSDPFDPMEKQLLPSLTTRFQAGAVRTVTGHWFAST